MNYKKFKRIFVIVADSVGIGAEPDADKFFKLTMKILDTLMLMEIYYPICGLNLHILSKMVSLRCGYQ